MPRSKLFLTFDDSPDRACPEILDVLKAAKAKATFFLQAGRMVAKDLNYYTMIKRMVDEGHSLGVKLEEAKTPQDLNGSLERNLKAFQELFKKNGSTFPGFKLARLAWSNLKGDTYKNQLEQLGLSLVMWDVELAPHDKISHVKFPDWQGLAGLYSDSQFSPKDSNILLLYSPHWKDKKDMLGKLLAKLQNTFDLHPVETLPTFYLTFDDGPYQYSGEAGSRPGGTQVTLDVLKELGVKATFFICSKSNGISKEQQYKLVKRMLDEGHALGNHGDDHKPLTAGGYQGIIKSAEGKRPMSPSELENFKEAGDYDARTGTVTNIKAHVVKDFVDNDTYFKSLFKGNGVTLPDFIGSRLPGDGRKQQEIVKAVVERMKAPHFGWHMEFAPNGRMAHVSNKDWSSVSGVSATTKAEPQDQDMLLLHDLHWQDKKTQLSQLVLKLKGMGRLRTLEELPANMSKRFKEQFTPYPAS